jgi:hypothetical protein
VSNFTQLRDIISLIFKTRFAVDESCPLVVICRLHGSIISSAAVSNEILVDIPITKYYYGT